MTNRHLRKRRQSETAFLYDNKLLGIELRILDVPGGYTSMHYHDTLEIMFPLNGEASIRLEGRTYRLTKRQVAVIEEREFHSTTMYGSGMWMTIRINRQALSPMMPEIDAYRISCIPELVSDEKFEPYLRISAMMDELVKSYITDQKIYNLEATGLILQVLSLLFRNFGTTALPEETLQASVESGRIRDVVSYVQEHFREQITLGDACRIAGMEKSPFCRYFKQRIGMSFLTYVNEVRLTACYRDLVISDDTIGVIMEKNGIRSQKAFNASFKKLYGITPSTVRKTETETLA